jgi:hypothetical protein
MRIPYVTAIVPPLRVADNRPGLLAQNIRQDKCVAQCMVRLTHSTGRSFLSKPCYSSCPFIPV